MEKDIKTNKTSKVFRIIARILVAIGLLIFMAGAIWCIAAVLRYFW